MIRVKFSARPPADEFLRQFPRREPVWGNCEFVFDPDERRYDWFVAYDDLKPADGERFSRRVEEHPGSRARSVLITVEPSSIKTYGYDFLNQFGVILTSHEPWSISHPQTVRTQPPLRWFYGQGSRAAIDYDTMCSSPPLNKTDLISTVCSSKRGTHTLHTARYDFTQQLKTALPELAIFGHGVCPIDDKAEALDRFACHIAIENHVAPHHCTEKLADAFLGCTLPFYHGAPNAADYFSADSFIPIDIGQPEEAIDCIVETLKRDEAARRRDAVLESRRLVLDRYNLFAVLSREIEQRHALPAAVSSGSQRIYSRHEMRRRSMIHSARFFVDLMQARTRRWIRSRAA